MFLDSCSIFKDQIFVVDFLVNFCFIVSPLSDLIIITFNFFSVNKFFNKLKFNFLTFFLTC